MLRRAVISLLVALVLLIPAAGRQMDFTVPGMSLLAIPATGLDYMAVFFHEIGHTIFRWLFGFAALPTFDWQDGGGMTYAADRSMMLQYFIWFLMAAGVAWLWQQGERALAVAAGVVAGIFAALSFSYAAREGIPVYMGHGAEILVACFCIWRGMTGAVAGNKAVERWLNLVFGIYTLGRNMLMNVSLFDEIGRAVYDMQKGGHIAGDFRQLSLLFHADIMHVAVFSSAFMVVALLVAVWLAARSSRA